MSDDVKRRFVEALDHWASTIDSLRAQERAAAIAQAKEVEKARHMEAFLSSPLGMHQRKKYEES
ncbi:MULTISPECIES: hypothetical protein [Pseudomonas putida group]|uniref:Uncharacterized protein n=2 Tax=Pseudomonas putida group TaxID=136845 RepID=A0A2N1IW35_9PSED|nr:MULTISPECIES: hypothetical protein [Pseudomonas putida group]MCO1622736.1 hypothetical protein [Pseudomonas putida]PKI24929.1 hypothetical protein CXB65_06525 [Pseudomonas monteilii]RPD93787.1 hypothetical protein EGN69_12880 [Pseudomonas monteilii]